MTDKKKAWKVGDKFRVKMDFANYVLGKVYTVSALNGTVGVCGSDDNGTNIGNWISCESNYISRLENTKAELEKEKAELMVEMAEVDAKIKFLDDNSLDTYDEHEFKIYQALTVLDETTDKLQRTKKLAELLKDLA